MGDVVWGSEGTVSSIIFRGAASYVCRDVGVRTGRKVGR